MTQQIGPVYAAPTYDQHPAGAAPTTAGWPTANVPTQGYPPPGTPMASHHAPRSYGAPVPPYGVPTGAAVAGPTGGRGPLWIALGVVATIVVVLGGVLGWMLLAPAAPATAPAPAPATSQPATAPAAPAAPSAPSDTSPAIAASARTQFTAAISRYDQAATRFQQDTQNATNAGDMGRLRAAVTDFRTATYGYDAEIRNITFPNEQQTVVNSQLLPATGRLVGDLDQLANLDPSTVRSTATRTAQDAQTVGALSKQVLVGVGG